jgi:hypothetical protein
VNSKAVYYSPFSGLYYSPLAVLFTVRGRLKES